MSNVVRLAGVRRESQREEVRPVLKWAGGKKRLLHELLPRLPERFGRYFEPFFGGGALYFSLQPEVATLGDVNSELMTVYRCVRDELDALVAHLQRHRYEKDYYYRMRALDPRDLTPVERASRTIYLNRTCFNGLYRVNRRGQFNVPFGRYSNPVICQEDRLEAASRVLQNTSLREGDFRWVVDEAREGDLVYFDPPYQPISRTSNFTSYAAGGFGEDDQVGLADVFARLASRGVRCVLSNSDTPLVRELYEDFRVETVLAPRAISRRADGRRPVREVIVRSW
ncbi:MAG: DNA adenine methylase [Myxococcota bacterium]